MKKRYSVLWALVCVLILLLSGCLLPSAAKDDSKDSDGTETENTEVLSALGLNLDAYDDSDVAAEDSPYGEEVTNVNPVKELFTVTAGNLVQLADISTSLISGLSVATSALDTSDGIIKRPVAADLDGNGKDEVVMASFNVSTAKISFFTMNDTDTYKVTANTFIDWADASLFSVLTTTESWTMDLSRTQQWNHQIDLASGDIDGDGNDELCIASGATLYIIDESFNLLASQSYTSLSGAANQQLLRVECGDIDGDGTAEIAVANGSHSSSCIANVYVYKWSGSALETVVNARPATAASVSLRSAELKIGDLDGDGYQELVVGGSLKTTGTPANETIVMYFTITGGVIVDSFYDTHYSDDYNADVHTTSNWETDRAEDLAVPILALADFDGDGAKEIVSGDDVLSLSDGELDLAFDGTGGEILRAGIGTEYMSVGYGSAWTYRAPYSAYYNQVAAGDIDGELDGDGNAHEEVVIMGYDRNHVNVLSFNSNLGSGGQVVRGSDIAIDTDMPNGVIETGYGQYLCLADVDTDSTVIKYVGHELVFSNPLILAVLASPPYWAGQDSEGSNIQNWENMATVLGTSTAVSAGTELTYSAGVSILAGEKLAVPIISNGEETLKVKTTVRTSVSFGVSVSSSININHISMAGHNSVIFTSIPIHTYWYEVVSASSEDGTAEGELVKIVVEDEAQVCMVEQDFYNANNGGNPDVDDTIMTHAVGRPTSYMTKAQAAALPVSDSKLFVLTNAVNGTTYQGNNLLEVSYANSAVAGATFAVEYETEIEFEASFLGLAGFGGDLSSSVAVSASLELGTSISGTVGGLSAEYYTSDYRYTWGLCAYEATLPDTALPFAVINYWVNQ